MSGRDRYGDSGALATGERGRDTGTWMLKGWQRIADADERRRAQLDALIPEWRRATEKTKRQMARGGHTPCSNT
jgi:hypothetical protein